MLEHARVMLELFGTWRQDPADLENFCRNYADFRAPWHMSLKLGAVQAVLAEAGLLPPRGPGVRRHETTGQEGRR